MSLKDWVKRTLIGATDDPIRMGKLVRGLLSSENYQALSDDQRAAFAVGAMDMFNQMIRYSLPGERQKLVMMSDYAGSKNSAALRDMFDQYLAEDPTRTEVFAANAFLIFLSEETRKHAGIPLTERKRSR